MSKELEEKTIIYRRLKAGENPPKPKPPLPCNAWCAKEVILSSGQTTVTIMPWLDESFGKKVIAGVDSNGPVLVDHLKFDDPDYMVFEESHARFDKDGEIVYRADENGDLLRDKSGNLIPDCDFDYVVGVPGIAFVSQHLFRASAALNAINTNMLRGFSAILQLIQEKKMKEGVDAPASGSSMPIDNGGLEV